MSDEEQVRLLKEIARWTRFSALPAAKDRLSQLLDTDPKKRVYAALDGGSSMRDVEKATGANHTTINEWLKLWAAEGILESGANPPKALFTLRELGIESAPDPVRRPRKASGGA